MKFFIGIIITVLCVPFVLSMVGATESVPACDRKSCDPEYDCILNRCGATSGVTTRSCNCLPAPSSTKKNTYCDSDWMKTCPVATPACILPVIEDYFSLSFSKISSPDVDIVFAFDTTGSMGGTIETAKKVGGELLEKLDDELGNRVNFALVDFRDYPINPYGASVDYPYRLIVDLTDNKGDIERGIDSLSIGNGADGPESYLRVMYEAYTTIKWRKETKKVLVFLGDSKEHDPDLPPRDGMEKIYMKDAIAKFKSEGIALLYLDVGNYAVKHWEGIAEQIGNGSGAFRIGTSKGDEFVKEIIERIIGVVRKVKEVYLTVFPEKYTPWVIYEKLDGLHIPPSGMEYRFPYKIMPTGADISKVHYFEIKLFGDKTRYATKSATVEIKCDGKYASPTPTLPMLPSSGPEATVTPRPRVCNMCGVVNKESKIGTQGGDYNCDGVLDIADYSIWRKEFLDKIIVDGYIMSDGNCDGISDTDDYSAWRNLFIK
jgi:Mg-chelatase subunit ChlD